MTSFPPGTDTVLGPRGRAPGPRRGQGSQSLSPPQVQEPGPPAPVHVPHVGDRRRRSTQEAQGAAGAPPCPIRRHSWSVTPGVFAGQRAWGPQASCADHGRPRAGGPLTGLACALASSEAAPGAPGDGVHGVCLQGLEVAQLPPRGTEQAGDRRMPTQCPSGRFHGWTQPLQPWSGAEPRAGMDGWGRNLPGDRGCGEEAGLGGPVPARSLSAPLPSGLCRADPAHGPGRRLLHVRGAARPPQEDPRGGRQRSSPRH